MFRCLGVRFGCFGVYVAQKWPKFRVGKIRTSFKLPRMSRTTPGQAQYGLSFKNRAAALQAMMTPSQQPRSLNFPLGKVPHEFWLWPVVARNPVFPLTTILQFRQRQSPNWPDSSGYRISSKGGAEGREPKISRFFFIFPPIFVLFVSLSGGLLVVSWCCLEAPGPLNVHVWSSRVVV